MNKTPDCFMCQDPIFEKGTLHPIKIAELGVSTAILNRDWQFYKGSTLLVFQDHETELHHLDPDTQHRFMDDASRTAAALEKTYPMLKINRFVASRQPSPLSEKLDEFIEGFAVFVVDAISSGDLDAD